MKIIKILFNPRVASALVSAISAVICATLAGCKLACGKFELSDLSAEIFNTYYNNSQMENVK